MEPAVLTLVLLSAFLHAVWNALLKRHEDPEAGVVCIAGYHVAYKQALAAGAQPPALFALSLAVGLPMLLLTQARREKRGAVLRQARKSPLRMLAAGTLRTLSFGLLLTALARGGAGAVLTLRNMSIAFALGLAVLQGERPGRGQISGAVLVIAGAVLLGWPA